MRSGLSSSRTTSTTRSATASRCCSARGRTTWPPTPRRCRSSHPPGTVWNYSQRHDEHRQPHRRRRRRRRRGRRSRGGDARRSSRAAVRPARDDDRRSRSSTPRARSSGRRTCTRPRATSPGSASCYLRRRRVGDGRRLLPAGWVDHARDARRRRPTASSATAGTGGCGRDLPGAFACHGYEGQYTSSCPTGTSSSCTSARARPSSARRSSRSSVGSSMPCAVEPDRVR